MQVQHFRGHDDAPLRAIYCRQELELHVQRCDARRRINVESVRVYRVARPFQARTPSFDDQAGDSFDAARRRVIAR